MRIATYNVENLFSRVSAMNSADPAKTTVVLEDVAKLQRLIEQPLYSEADKKQMLAILRKHRATGSSGPFFLQETRRRLYSNGKIVAEGRGDWVGSIEWRRDLIQAPAIENTGRVINEVKADILCLVEVESRPVLRRFNDTALKEAPYPHAMLIDGNDDDSGALHAARLSVCFCVDPPRRIMRFRGRQQTQAPAKAGVNRAWPGLRK